MCHAKLADKGIPLKNPLTVGMGDFTSEKGV